MMRRDPTRPSARQGVSILAGVGAAFALIMLVATLQGYPQVRPVDFGSGSVMPPGSAETPLEPPTIPDIEPGEENPILAVIAAVVGIVFAVVIAWLVVRLLIRLVRRLWHARALRRRAATPPAPSSVAAPAAQEPVDAPIVRDGIVGALGAIEAHPVASDAIVAAWIGLEESAERAGQQRGIAETPGEFTLRIVGHRQSIADDTRMLLRLYESVRFGGRPASESDRDEARGLLRRIQRGWE